VAVRIWGAGLDAAGRMIPRQFSTRTAMLTVRLANQRLTGPIADRLVETTRECETMASGGAVVLWRKTAMLWNVISFDSDPLRRV
jgi:hypothetical protein